MLLSQTAFRLKPAQAALIVLMHQYLLPMMDVAVTVTEAHELMYFLQETGENLGLRYKRAPYGVHAQNLHPLLDLMQDSFITFGEDVEGIVENPLYLKPGAFEQAEKLLLDNANTLARCIRITNLFEGFESAYHLELLATVHWVATKEQATAPELAVESVQAWNDRQKAFAPYDIKFTWQHLKKQGWL
ncbi:MAG: hypothetical protein AAFV85_24330 [Cyanobacteria bacterium J06634_6]